MLETKGELHNSTFICVGDGTKGSECGYTGKEYNNGICPKCSGMIISEKGIRESESFELIEIWKDF